MGCTDRDISVLPTPLSLLRIAIASKSNMFPTDLLFSPLGIFTKYFLFFFFHFFMKIDAEMVEKSQMKV